MGFIDENLMQGESVIYRTKLHWIEFLFPALVLIVGFLSLAYPDKSVAKFFIIIAIILVIRSLVIYLTSEFGITNKRVLIKTGFLNRQSHEILLNKTEAIEVSQSVLGRSLDYGTITIKGTGGSKDPFSGIVSPLEFRKQAQEQIAKTE